MCHGSFLERAATSVPDLLRETPLEPYLDAQPFDELLEFNSSVYGSGGDDLLIDDPAVSGDTLADIIEDFSSGVKKLNSSNDRTHEDGDKLGPTRSLSAWFDCIVRDIDGGSVTSSAVKKDISSEAAAEETAGSAPKSRKAQKKVPKDPKHGINDSEMDDAAPTLIDEKRKRRMSSNRASAQRSRQRKQERLEELEVLTAQLRLENATLLRKSKLAVQLAKKYEGEKNSMAKKVEELADKLKAARQQLHPGTPDAGDGSITTHQMSSTGVCNMVEGGLLSPDPCVELEAPPAKDNSEPKAGQIAAVIAPPQRAAAINAPPTPAATKKPTIPGGGQVMRSLFQELLDSIDSEKFDLSVDTDVQDIIPEEWLETFAECLST